MSQETSNAIIAIVAAISLAVSILTSLFSVIQTIRQGKETKALAVLTTDLEHKVHRLATNLDYKIGMLNRVRDLVTGLIETSTVLRQNSTNYEQKLGAAVKRDMTFPELDALALHIKDEKLTNLTRQLIETVTTPYDLWPQLWNTSPIMLPTEVYEQIDPLLIKQSSYTGQIHRRILELVEQTTQTDT